MSSCFLQSLYVVLKFIYHLKKTNCLKHQLFAGLRTSRRGRCQLHWVSELLNTEGTDWDYNRINVIFSTADAEAITEIRLSERGRAGMAFGEIGRLFCHGYSAQPPSQMHQARRLTEMGPYGRAFGRWQLR